MSDPLATYLQDHLAGSVHAVELVEHLRDNHKGEWLGDFAAQLLVEIQSDQEVLQQLAERVGAGSSNLKEMGAWIGEKLARLKLGQKVGDNLATLEALEVIQLGITGKLGLWSALAEVAPGSSQLEGPDYARLSARAKSQIEQVERRRLQAARLALL
jgi:hypothetical protein